MRATPVAVKAARRGNWDGSTTNKSDTVDTVSLEEDENEAAVLLRATQRRSRLVGRPPNAGRCELSWCASCGRQRQHLVPAEFADHRTRGCHFRLRLARGHKVFGDGDGVTTSGVVRGNTWFLRCRSSSTAFRPLVNIASRPVESLLRPCVELRRDLAGFGTPVACAAANFGFAAVNSGNRFASKGVNRNSVRSAFLDFGFAGLKTASLRRLRHTPRPSRGLRLASSGVNAFILAGYAGARSAISSVSGL